MKKRRLVALAFLATVVWLTLVSLTSDLSPPALARPVIAPLQNISAIAAGFVHTCALPSRGGVKCWGGNSSGQLGDGTDTNRRTLVDVVGLSSGVSAIAAGGNHTCTLTSGSGVKCWGGNNYGQLGDGTSAGGSLIPVDVVGLSSGVSAIAAGSRYTCALTSEGGVKCWGLNSYGLLGDGTVTDRRTPVDVVGLSSGVSAIVAAELHTCALTSGGEVKCWGRNYLGQLGDGTTTYRLTPIDVVGVSSGVSAIAVGGNHTCALTSGGGVKCWGGNNYGQLGDGTSTGHLTPVHLTPVDVVGLSSGVSAIVADEDHTCVLTSGSGVKCWGRNDYGQLGDGTTTHRLTPVDVVGLSSGVSAIAVGGNHTCALTSGSGVKCWGRNELGQLGDGTVTHRLTPVDVVNGVEPDDPNSITGQIIDTNNNPIPGVTVSTNGGKLTTTGADGSYTLPNLANGTYTLMPSKAGYNFSPVSRTITVPPAQSNQNFTAIDNEIICSVETALELLGISSANDTVKSYDTPAELLTLYTRLRDEVFSPSETGQEHIDLFNDHTTELAVILMNNPDLRSRTAQFLQNASEAFASLLPDATTTVPLEPDLYKDANDLIQDLAAAGSPEFNTKMTDVWEELALGEHIGKNAIDIWIGMQPSPDTTSVYLPLIVK